MISAISWIPRGVAKAIPEAAEFTQEELAAARSAAEEGEVDVDENDQSETSMDSQAEEEDDEAAQVKRAKALAAALKGSSAGPAAATADLDTAMAELDMDRYDEDDEEEEGVKGMFGSSNPGMAYYRNSDEDPYIQLSAVRDADSEAEDFEIRGDDFLILAARNENDVSHIEVWVYEEADEVGAPTNLYVHHDVLLPAFPLSLAWMDCGPSGRTESGNFAAVGTMEPGIEIWDLDIIDAVEPAATLGGKVPGAKVEASMAEEGDGVSTKKKKKKKKKKQSKALQVKEGSHSDAVLGLSWNREYRNVLASASADASVKVWDVATQSCQATLQWHSDKVQAVAWNPADAPVLLSGGFDRKVFLGDARTPSGNLSWDVSTDVEALAWDPYNPTRFLVSSEDGIVAAFDARSGAGAAPMFRLSAHHKPACCLSFNPAAKGLLATASTDKQVKLWDISDKPALIAAQDMKIGALFSACFCPEQPSLFASGGAKGEVAVWDILTSAAIASKYGKELAQAKQKASA